MAIEQLRVTTSCSHRWRRLLSAAVTGTALLAAVTATGAAPPESGHTVTVQPGDSWLSVRHRLFPVDALRQANPGLDAEVLRPGDVVRAPYVPTSTFARERAARTAVEQQLAQAKARLTEFERTAASLERTRRDLASAERSLAARPAIIVGLVLVALVLLVVLAALAQALLAARRHLRDLRSRDRALQSRYDDLRRSLHDIDVKLQGRVVALLQVHGGKVVTDSELTAALAPVMNITHELRARHGGTDARSSPAQAA
jgi:hypothetical protein